MTITTYDVATIRIGGVEYPAMGEVSFGPPSDDPRVIPPMAVTLNREVTSSAEITMTFDSNGEGRVFWRRMRRLCRTQRPKRRRAKCQTRQRKFGRPERRRVEAFAAFLRHTANHLIDEGLVEMVASRRPLVLFGGRP